MEIAHLLMHMTIAYHRDQATIDGRAFGRRPVFFTLVLVLFLTACTTVPPQAERLAHADALAASREWRADILSTDRFDLLTYTPQHIEKHPQLTVYIEGDGLAWINRSTPSADPTPLEPIALRLALAQPEGNAAYLGRPCQYVAAPQSACPERYWTQARFAPEVISASNQAINQLKQRFGAKRLRLVGYSGGGAIATLLAARRDDIEQLITVAGNLDHHAWTTLHRLSPLSDSLNPSTEQTEMLLGVHQWHFMGSEDKIIPASLATVFSGHFPPANRPTIDLIKGFDHQCCWVSEWPNLWRKATHH